MSPENPLRAIIVVEDSDADFYTLQRAFQKAGVTNPVIRYTRGEDAINSIASHDVPKTAFLMLDLNLPGIAGTDVLERLKSDEALRSIPIVVMTTSSNPRDVDTAYRAGANSYHLKVIDFQEFLKTVQTIVVYWLDESVLPSEERTQ